MRKVIYDLELNDEEIRQTIEDETRKGNYVIMINIFKNETQIWLTESEAEANYLRVQPDKVLINRERG